MSKVGLITGAGSGMGLAVARALAAKGWKLSLFDVDADAGEATAQELHATFHEVDVADYDAQAAAFDKTWKEFGRLDFVYANAGISERCPYYEQTAAFDPASGPPPRPNLRALDINLQGVIHTSYLAGAYLAQNAPTPGGVLVMTASCVAIYPASGTPIYTATKHGVLGLMRALAPMLRLKGVRVNATCPGLIPTNILPKEQLARFPMEMLTSLDKVVEAVLGFIEDESAEGQAVEISGDKTYVRGVPPFSDGTAKLLMDALGAPLS